MKKSMRMLLSAMLVFSLAGCSAAPSDEEIKAALDDGTITVEDAKAKGWIDNAWIEANFEQIEAQSKIYPFSPFETTYLDGTAASSELIEGEMCLAFINELEDGTLEKLEEFNSVYQEMEATGVPIMGIVSDSIDTATAKEALKDIGFPLIVCNEDMQRSMAESGFDTMMDYDVVSVFTKEGGVYTAWRNSATSEDLVDFAKDLINEE